MRIYVQWEQLSELEGTELYRMPFKVKLVTRKGWGTRLFKDGWVYKESDEPVLCIYGRKDYKREIGRSMKDSIYAEPPLNLEVLIRGIKAYVQSHFEPLSSSIEIFMWQEL